ncbi:hypothetical protein B0H13DRAFT_1850365 [Mycena leptocephala]|nr:hypothetical protein B0H13DRAFT_1850365 [Mycena leptocephala]
MSYRFGSIHSRGRGGLRPATGDTGTADMPRNAVPPSLQLRGRGGLRPAAGDIGMTGTPSHASTPSLQLRGRKPSRLRRLIRQSAIVSESNQPTVDAQRRRNPTDEGTTGVV